MSKCGTFNATFTEPNNLNASFKELNDLKAEFGEVQRVSTGNYEELIKKPMIEGHELIGDKTFKELGMVTLSVQDIEKILYLD